MATVAETRRLSVGCCGAVGVCSVVKLWGPAAYFVLLLYGAFGPMYSVYPVGRTEATCVLT